MALDLEALNDAQREAVLYTDGPLLVLAGAGSGKTRVLTYRIAHLVEDLGVAPWEICAITFTNKAAREMRERLSSLLGVLSRGMWVSTFHSMAVRILRSGAERLGFRSNFTICDSDDEKRLARAIMEDLGIDSHRWPQAVLMNRISAAKNELVGPEEFEQTNRDPAGRVTASLYHELQKRLKAANAFDFDDLLYYTYVLFKENEDLRASYEQRFTYLLVDEYQDTNHAQYEICRQIVGERGNLMVVGDDDQSIYSWRCADIRNILEFEKDFPDARVVKLEQNYRSTGSILKAANAVIAHNRHRKPKTLFTAGEDGDLVEVYLASDERDEGRWIAGQIERFHDKGMSYEAMALLYRTNAQSRILEDMLLRAGVPYRIVGGTRFFDRMEIRDVMAYLTLVVNPDDDLAARRVINVPKRGIGKTTVAVIDRIAREHQLSFFEAAEQAIADETLRPSTRTALAQFVAVIREAQTYEGNLRFVIDRIIERSGMRAAYEQEKTDEAQMRIENIDEFLGVVDEFFETHNDEEAFFAAPDVAGAGVETHTSVGDGDVLTEATDTAPQAPVRVLRGDSLADFIEWVALRTDLDAATDDGHAVTLMTVHSAKGLEFDLVFVTGLEESIFPHINSLGNENAIEEERRLAYVAITRAKKRLYLTCAQTRQLYGRTDANPASRFITEIPTELRHNSGLGSVGLSGTGWEKRGSRRGIAGSGPKSSGKASEEASGRRFGEGSSSLTGSSGAARFRQPTANVTYAVNDWVDHKAFGRGQVVAVDGDSVSVRFNRTGAVKKLLRDFAPMVKINR